MIRLLIALALAGCADHLQEEPMTSKLPPGAPGLTANGVPPEASAAPEAPTSAAPPPSRLMRADGTAFDPVAEEVKLVARAEKAVNMIEAVEEQARLGQWVNKPAEISHWEFFYAGQIGEPETMARVAEYEAKGWSRAPVHPSNGLPPYLHGMQKVASTSAILCAPPHVWGRQRERTLALARKRQDALQRRFGSEESQRLRDQILERAPRSEVRTGVQFAQGVGRNMTADLAAMQRQF